MSKLTRRQFLLATAAAGASLFLDRKLGRRAQASPQAVPAGRVIHAHSPEATYWDYATGWYGDYVDQAVVNAMTDRGVMALTGTTTPADAWGALLPAYTAGQKVAIKVNLNNATCDSSDNVIDALPQPVNSVIRGLKSIGVAESDICVYDVTNGWHAGAMPQRLVNKVAALYPGVRYDAYDSSCLVGTQTYVDGYGGDVFTACDNMLHSGAPTINFGDHDVYDVSAARRFIQKFNLSAIPSGSACISAKLYYYKASAVPNNTVNCTIYAVSAANAAWREGTQYGGTAGAGDSCWNYLDADPNGPVPWAGSAGLSTAGVDYEATAIGSFVIPPNAQVGDEYVVDLDTTRIAGWFGATNTNYGILLVADGMAEYIGSAEHANTAYRPKLVVEYGSAVSSGGYSATEKVHFNVPAGKPAISDRPLCNALVDADYLINMPIMKKHGMAGVTLGFKNHFGSLEHCDYVHWSVDLGDGNYTLDYNGLVDIYNNTHIKNKTVLTVGDALYAARFNNYDEVPGPWPSFGNQSPDSLFFAVDPVAVDCVMTDFLSLENGLPDGSDDYLKLAAAAGLGVYERWDASHQYQEIDYQRLEVTLDLPEHLYLPLVGREG